MGSFGTHRRSMSIMFYILGLTLCSVFRATEIDRTVSRNMEERDGEGGEEEGETEGGRGAEQEIVNIKMECCPISLFLLSQDEFEMFESWRVMDAWTRRRSSKKRGRIGTCEWRNFVSLLDRLRNRIRISLMRRISCSSVQTLFLHVGWECGLKLPPRFPNMLSEHGLHGAENEGKAVRRASSLSSAATVGCGNRVLS